MNASTLAAYLGDRYGAYLATVGRASAYSVGALKAPIDDAYLALGYVEADIATINVIEVEALNDLKAMASYQTMAQIVRDLGAKAFDIGTSTGSSYKLNQQRAAAEKDLKTAEEVVLARGLSLVSVGELDELGATWNLNFLEPVRVAWR